MSDTHAAAHHDAAHSHEKIYWVVITVLAVITLVEVVAPSMRFLPLPLLYASVGLLAVVKFVMVCQYFMHLKYDGRLVTFLFVSGLVMAVGTLLALVALSNVESLQPLKPRVAQALKPADAKRGKEVFANASCVSCHMVTGVEGANGKIGPALDGVGSRAGSRVAGLTAEAYIKQSIEQPDAYKVKGYEGQAMTAGLRDSMTDQEYVDLVAWLLSLK